MTPEQLRSLVARYGTNTNHFLVTYGGFELFEGPSGAVAYVEKPHAWVAAGEPLAEKDRQLAAWREFVQAARARGKGAVCIPAGSGFTEAARAAGFGSLVVGSEPLIELASYPPSGQTWLSLVATAKQLQNKGARVREVTAAELAGAKREELETITREWLDSRKMGALAFLNRVEPWSSQDGKRYFEVVVGGRTTAFVAAVPITPRQGWYLIDVLRRCDTEAGTTELLLLETMKLLGASGAREVSLGVAPLAGLERAPEAQRSSRLGKILSLVYEDGDLFYNFRSLHQYKLKFQPTRWEPAHIVFDTPKLQLATAVSLLQAFVPRGLTFAAASGAWRLVTQFELQRWIKSKLSPTVVVRSAPSSLFRLAFRCRSSLGLTIVLWTTAATTFSEMKLRPEIAARWAYSFEMLRKHPDHALLLAPFLHWNIVHLVTNTLLALVFCGLLEYLAGSFLTVLVFVLGAVAANPLASLPFLLGASGATETDVGASLGILACGGAVSSLLKRGWRLALVLVAGSSALAAVNHSWLGLNHVAAVAVGWLVARAYFRMQ